MRKWLRRGLLILFGGAALVSAFMLARYFIDSNKQNSQFDELAGMVQQAKPAELSALESQPENGGNTEPAAPIEPPPLPEYVEVSALNPDMVGWMTIEGTKINYPVMHTPQQEDKYLHLDFYGKYSNHGCLYAQEESSIDPPSDNITVYGHNMKDGSMFADLLNYDNQGFWESHRCITFDTLMEHRTYEIFAVFRTTATKGQGFAYHHFVNAGGPEAFGAYVEECKALSLYDTGITPEYGDKLITLSTCEYTQANGRFVVVAKRID